jgi:hypothetical protein
VPALFKNGPEHITTVVEGVRSWEHGYESVEQAKGSMSQVASPDPAESSVPITCGRSSASRAPTTGASLPRSPGPDDHQAGPSIARHSVRSGARDPASMGRCRVGPGVKSSTASAGCRARG